MPRTLLLTSSFQLSTMQNQKAWLLRAFYDLAATAPSKLTRELAKIYHPDAHWRGSHPLNEHHGVAAIERDVWLPLISAFPDLERRDAIIIGGQYQERDYIACMGHYCGTFRNDWLTIPSTGRPVYLRYGEVHHVDQQRIKQSTVLIDVLDVMRQAGFWPIAPSLGTETPWPGPITGDGIVLDQRDPAESAASLTQTLAMQKTLGDYSDDNTKGRAGLLNMAQKEYWHPKMMWYGPCGIGTTRGLQGFVDYHQLPFRIAFPNRQGGNHYIRVGDGHFSVTGGWPSVTAKHSGGDFLGTSPTGRDVTMRVMDFYCHHEGLIRENWVPIDIIHLLLQMDIDVLARMQSLFRRGGRIDAG
jgi:predicted ester cyclase